jgi:uncharacterized protein YciI
VFLIEFDYHAPLDAIDGLREAHYTNPDGLFGRGLAVLAGPLVPRTGGLVIADGTRAEIEAAVASDPFITNDVATARIVEFRVAQNSTAQPN